MAKNYGKKAEELENNENIKEYIKQGIENEKAINFLVENAKEVKKSETHKKIREIPLRRVYTSSSVKRFGQQRAWGRFRHGPRA